MTFTRAMISIQMGRSMGTGGDCFSLRIIDETSGIIMVDTNLSLGDLAYVGRQRVVSSVLVPWQATPKVVDEAVAQQLPPDHDWDPRYEDARNPHRHAEGEGRMVGVTVFGWKPRT